MGRSLLLQTQIALGLGDSSRARALLARAIEPLEFGYGRQHTFTREAVALRDALGR